MTLHRVDEASTLYVGGNEFGDNFDGTVRKPGHEMRIDGVPHMTVTLPKRVTFLGFDGGRAQPFVSVLP